jgi:hypothetical protein
VKITIESTAVLVTIDGTDIQCRVWEGQEESGEKILCLIPRVFPTQLEAKNVPLSEFQSELLMRFGESLRDLKSKAGENVDDFLIRASANSHRGDHN